MQQTLLLLLLLMTNPHANVAVNGPAIIVHQVEGSTTKIDFKQDTKPRIEQIKQEKAGTE